MAYTTIDDPSAYFQVVLYSGNGTDDRDIALGTTQFAPNLTVIKRRDDTNSWKCFDTVRGATKQIIWDGDNAESTFADGLQVFNSDGFEVGADEAVNASGGTYLSLNWKESTTAGFDIIDYDGSGSNATVSHNLSAVPKTIWVKEYSHSTNWAIYHQGAGNTNFLKFNSTAGDEDTDNWQDTTPTSSVFSIGSGGQTNNSGRDYIAYCFAEKQGFSKFGTYVGTGADDGPFVFTGFRPAMVIYKRRGGTEGWMMQDSKRPGFNPIGGNIFPNSTGAESTDARFDFLSNGFKARSGNQNSDETTPYIYMAWAAAPFVNSNGVPSTAF